MRALPGKLFIRRPFSLPGYWPSYNIPFYESIYDAADYPSMVRRYGTDFSYELAPRAKIFRRDAGAVQAFKDMMDIMRYNGGVYWSMNN